ncbi:cytochrome b/b6 domain-containing protein [Edwardsiella piscicida]|uniref:cytochrome b/b6 domain-containing protein n=1 Tax=Edwardsiella piscicida TaxID=1263550 RepID=UPI00054CC51A|nr:cytochrome b/b6 domain-containing protein [Edwardsiella piscicida]ELM3658726.1 cytochrome b/b6 domain-containing protein [Edwardsiella piscicida]QBB11606.1 cytochrome B [Edwardsiella piscicida]UCQ15471.1 cytochrome b/b6 domain-containing protein [Edwardsiella piscicida]UCQ38666.1 cytochrome b/b6 domain-containing protein [Edwardsiella piscicida]UCQ41990.1 cytochrome b/b6 domain-containing protein [Edwardsiella piscicida]
MNGAKVVNVHPLWLRLCHWINAVAIFLMILSGWRIYDASPLFDFSFPKQYTLGGWLGGALQWHFAAMWLFAVNGAVYLAINIIGGRFRRRFWPISLRQLGHDIADALRGRLAHDDPHHYNAVQKCAYLSAICAAVVLLLSGLVLWKSVQFPLLRELLGGYEAARYIHFYAMAFVCAFLVVHVVMVALVPKTLLAMLRGR